VIFFFSWGVQLLLMVFYKFLFSVIVKDFNHIGMARKDIEHNLESG